MCLIKLFLYNLNDIFIVHDVLQSNPLRTILSTGSLDNNNNNNKNNNNMNFSKIFVTS